MIFSSIPPKFYEKPGGIDDFLFDSARIFRSNSLLYVLSPRGRVILSGQPNPWISRSNVTGINRFPSGMEYGLCLRRRPVTSTDCKRHKPPLKTKTGNSIPKGNLIYCTTRVNTTVSPSASAFTNTAVPGGIGVVAGMASELMSVPSVLNT